MVAQSGAAVFPSANYETEGFSLGTTNETTVYTVPVGFEGGVFITEIIAADQDGTANSLTLKVTIDGTAYIFGKAEAFAANVPYERHFTSLVLNEGDTIKLTAASITVDGYVGFIQNARES